MAKDDKDKVELANEPANSNLVATTTVNATNRLTGWAHGVYFVDGVGETDDPRALKELKKAGFEVGES